MAFVVMVGKQVQTAVVYTRINRHPVSDIAQYIPSIKQTFDE